MDIKMNDLTTKYYPPRLAIGERRVRTNFSDVQLEGLERAFGDNKYPDYQAIADKFNINIGRVKIWFQNKRARRMNKKNPSGDYENTPKSLKKSSPKLNIKPKPTFKATNKTESFKLSPSPPSKPVDNPTGSEPQYIQPYTKSSQYMSLPQYISPNQYQLPSPTYLTPTQLTNRNLVSNNSIDSSFSFNSNYPFSSPTNSATSPTASDVRGHCSSTTSGCSSGSGDSEDEFVDVCGLDDGTPSLVHKDTPTYMYGDCGVALDLRSDITKLRGAEFSPTSSNSCPVSNILSHKSESYHAPLYSTQMGLSPNTYSSGLNYLTPAPFFPMTAYSLPPMYRQPQIDNIPLTSNKTLPIPNNWS